MIFLKYFLIVFALIVFCAVCYVRNGTAGLLIVLVVTLVAASLYAYVVSRSYQRDR